MEGRLHPETVSERAVVLRASSAGSRKRFRLSQTGTESRILVESRRHRGRMVGLTDNYIPLLSPEGSEEGALVDVTITEENICWDLR
jgi:tRNA A37 methylthiotransferase MiaB